MFKQYAKGSFSCGVEGPFHCGPDDTTPKQFDYEVLLKYPPEALDEKGFLLDNMEFKSYFTSISSTSISCEQLAKQACEYFRSRAGDRAKHIEVSIWGIPGSVAITCAWPEEN